MPLMPHFVAAGFDILNPVQFTAKGMEPETVKAKFGESLVVWGAGVDTQKVLPFGTPDEVRAQVRENIRVFAPGGGFVFGTVHNVQPPTPVENLLAMYETVAEMRLPDPLRPRQVTVQVRIRTNKVVDKTVQAARAAWTVLIILQKRHPCRPSGKLLQFPGGLRF